MFEKIKAILLKPSFELGLCLFVFCLMLAASGLQSVIEGKYFHASIDFVLLVLVQYNYWSNWKPKLDN